MIFRGAGPQLELEEVPKPRPGPGEVLLRVLACGVCRTDLHIIDHELSNPKLPLIPGHEIIGEAVELGGGVERFKLGDRVGVPWLGWTCGVCEYCRSGRENLCDRAQFTGYTRDGGYAEFTVADQRYCFPIPGGYSDPEAAPLLCAGLIGYRALSKTGGAKRVGLYGFGAAAHIIAQAGRFQQRQVYAFTRSGDRAGQEFARSLGVEWAGGSDVAPPELLDAAIIFAPTGNLVPLALKAVKKGGIVVCAGIHMSEIPSFPYRILWDERTICSVANLTRKDGDELLALVPKVPIITKVQSLPLAQANQALHLLRTGAIKGACALIP